MSNSNPLCDPTIIVESQHPEKYPSSSREYILLSAKGYGAFSTVYSAMVKHSDEKVAIKIIDIDLADCSTISKEVAIIHMLKHPNIISVLTSFVDGQSLWIVMPLMVGGSCKHLLEDYPHGIKDEHLTATILKDILLGLAYIHKNQYIHRDIKCDNILISDGVCKISDFGVSDTLVKDGLKITRTTFTGTPCWMAPEVLEGKEYNEKADIWAFGITALELSFGSAPYSKYSPMKAMLMILENNSPSADLYNDRIHEFPSSFHDMVKGCLEKDPKNRPTARKLLKHKFFNLSKDAVYISTNLKRTKV